MDDAEIKEQELHDRRMARQRDTITLADLREHIKREHDTVSWIATLRDLDQLENEIRAARAAVR